MCLGIPMRIIGIKGDLAKVETGGLKRTVNIQLLPQARRGDYVIVHAGFAIEKLDKKRAKESLSLISRIAQEVFSKQENEGFRA